MALIYTLEFPDNLFKSSNDFNVAQTADSYEFTFNDPNVYISNRLDFNGDSVQFNTTDFRDYTPPVGRYVIPFSDVTTPDFKITIDTTQNKSKINYDFGLQGQTAKLIVDYIKFIRLPRGTNAYPEPAAELEYLFNLDKQVKIKIEDDCCPVLINGRGANKLILTGYIPLNTVRYCLDEGCTLNCTIFEDTKRTKAIGCIESTVLGTPSKVGILATAEVSNNKLRPEKPTSFARVPGKWFDVCIEPENPDNANLLATLLGFVKTVILLPLFAVFAVINILVTVVNSIITAINLIPGINLPLIDFDGIEETDNVFDQIFGIERVVEGLYGCKYVRGGYTVNSIVKSVCSICDFSREKFRDFTLNNNVDLDDFSLINIPISYNPIVPNGDATTQSGLESSRLDYIPAETAYKRTDERKLVQDQQNTSPEKKTKVQREIAVRAASIETTDIVLNRISSLWNTEWGVVNIPIENAINQNKEIQLQFGPLSGRYAFFTEELVDTRRDTLSTYKIENADICYDVGTETPIGYQTSWNQDASDTAANKAGRGLKGYISYRDEDYKDRKGKEVKEFKVDMAPTNFVGNFPNDTIYDDFREGRERILGFPNINEFFEEGLMVNSSEITSEPKLAFSSAVSTRVLDSGVASRILFNNRFLSAGYRMASEVFTTPVVKGDTIQFRGSAVDIFPEELGVQEQIPYYTVGYSNVAGRLQGIPDSNLSLLAEDFVNKYSSSIVDFDYALSTLKGGNEVVLGPFKNTVTDKEVVTDNSGYKFAPLMEFTFEKLNYSCGDDDLLTQCVTEAVVKRSNFGLYEPNPSYKLRLLRLTLGLGVVTSLEIDYENRNIKASGYVIPFNQPGITY